jgi:hypothetical protein
VTMPPSTPEPVPSDAIAAAGSPKTHTTQLSHNSALTPVARSVAAPQAPPPQTARLSPTAVNRAMRDWK